MNFSKMLSITSVAMAVMTIVCFVQMQARDKSDVAVDYIVKSSEGAQEGTLTKEAQQYIRVGSCTNNMGNFKRTLTSEEQQYIYGLIREIESVFDFFKDRIELFVDLRDKTPYRKFVGDLCSKIDLFTNETLKPLEQRVQNEINKDEPFNRGLAVVHELLVDFLDKLHAMRLVLVKYVSVKDNPEQAFALATELEPHLKALIAADVWNKLESKLTQVESLLNQVEDREIMSKLAALKVLLKKTRGSSSSVKISPTTLVSCIRKKIRYN